MQEQDTSFLLPRLPLQVCQGAVIDGFEIFNCILEDARGIPLTGYGHVQMTREEAEFIASRVNADYDDLLSLLHDARVAMVMFGNEMNWPPETPPEYAEVINKIRAIDEARADER